MPVALLQGDFLPVGLSRGSCCSTSPCLAGISLLGSNVYFRLEFLPLLWLTKGTPQIMDVGQEEAPIPWR